mmetsp:Transcript_82046/g.228678  ORF Transcript_82046/g.228678 Transcript_82046/m.228678 type:complete len:250 (+) Transcript_82046:87-836(+)|eukprot:CAMPEP_0117581626 /NCGR_PEP_ID=MMETSP0784-20121206/65939_1 /TAXON_ID=39447 /ORGANISM="" /LENGTH=249 /DNA_ID=CAMNT_0005381973 /DNA_START=86 /DNA_END=835 /DNA_ORIENTATION=-
MAGVQKSHLKKMMPKEKAKLLDASLKVYVGNLNDAVTVEDLTSTFSYAGVPVHAEIMKGGKACVAFGTAAEVTSAISMLNGSEFGGSTIEVDAWTQSSTPRKGKGKGASNNGASKWTPTVVKPPRKATWARSASQQSAPRIAQPPAKAKGWGKRQGKGKAKGKDRQVDNSQKLWIGGVPESATWKDLQQHFAQSGSPIWSEVQKGGVGVVAYASAEEAATAVHVFNGSEFKGAYLTVDAWTASPKRTAV